MAMTKPLLAIAWTATLLGIPVLSYFGRGLQRVVLEQASRVEVAMAFAAVTLGLAIGTGWWLARRRGPGALRYLAGAGVVAGFIFFLVPPGERWLHVPLFGLFGFLSVRLLGFRRGLAVALAVSILDEAWQHFLPDRVGDPVDAAINGVSSAMGALLARAGGASRSKVAE